MVNNLADMGSMKTVKRKACPDSRPGDVSSQRLDGAPLQVLYLDFDGVLHHDAVYRHPKRGIYVSPVEAPNHMLFEWVETLEDALTPYPEVKVVLATSWVRVLGYSRTVKRLPISLRLRVIGATYHSYHHSLTGHRGQDPDYNRLRGEEVCADVERRKPTAWVAVDDADEGWPEQVRDHLVICNSATGLGNATTQQRLREALACHFPPGARI